jgi:peptidoglycan hydrolase-like protein with peptidoglycan-binding domain
MQTLLFGAGSASITGSFDDATVQAVKTFQSSHTDRDGNPLTQDGVVGGNTWRALVFAN